MLYAVIATFRPGGLAEARRLRLEHYEFLDRVRGQIAEGGPLVGPDGVPTGMLIVLDRPSADAAHAFIADEPYTRAGLFESVAVRGWAHVFPEPVPGYVGKELEKERAARAGLV